MKEGSGGGGKRLTMKQYDDILKEYPESAARSTYDDKIKDYAVTSPHGRTKFGNPSLDSEPDLRSTIDHESVHLKQVKEGQHFKPGHHDAESVNELEAYLKEYNNRVKNKLTDKQLGRIDRQIKINYEHLRRTSPEYFDRVNHGIYELLEDDKCPKTVCSWQ